MAGDSAASPARVAASPFSAIVNGPLGVRSHVCGITAGIVRCWGWNDFGQTGQHAADESPTCATGERCVARPLPVQAPETVAGSP